MKIKTLTGMALVVLLATLSLSYGQAQRRPLPIITDQQVTTATLAGRMLDNVGNPISGTLVDCEGPEGTTSFVTGSDGAYRFNLSRTGHYTIRPRLEGYSGQAKFDVIVPGADFVLLQ
jgi:hypothetical protein